MDIPCTVFFSIKVHINLAIAFTYVVVSQGLVGDAPGIRAEAVLVFLFSVRHSCGYARHLYMHF